MSMQPREPVEVPVETVRVARAVFPKGSLAIRVRDELIAASWKRFIVTFCVMTSAILHPLLRGTPRPLRSQPLPLIKEHGP